MRRVKMVCTIGPASRDRRVLEVLIDAGMDVARLNMSHGTHAEHAESFHLIREIAQRKDRQVALLQDLSGAKIRLGQLESPVTLKAGDAVQITTRDMIGQGDLLPIRYPDFIHDVHTGSIFSMADGLLTLEVTGKTADTVRARIVAGEAEITSNKGVNLPEAPTRLPSLTEKDRADLKFGLALGFDWVALSFVRSARDAETARAAMREAGRTAPLLAKIEKRQALEDIDAILDVFDGIMVARGDLGLEAPLEEVPGIQKDLIRRANRRAKPVIVATQMLLSMVASPRPTRAEAADVANAVLDGADAVMLSEETAAGKYPAEAAQMLARIGASAEKLRAAPAHRDLQAIQSTPEGIASATCSLARSIGAALIVTPTTGGSTARLIASMKPPVRTLALSADPANLRRLALTWGVIGRVVEPISNTDQLFEVSRREALAAGLAKPGDRIVVTAGIPFNVAGSTNLLRVIEI
jgi:pyruvate kinase